METEIKLRVEARTAILGRLYQAGFDVSHPRHLERNTVYDTPARSLKVAGTLLRLRQADGACTLTWKGRSEPGRHKMRPEIETKADSCEALDRIFRELGYEPAFIYEKFRTEYRAGSQAGVIAFDETPIGEFLELEGPGEWIDRTASQLGFSQLDYILDSYAKLYMAECERRGVTPGNMIFDMQPVPGR
jgi:adenylate cyclase class 2